MNICRGVPSPVNGRGRVSYTGLTMTQHHALSARLISSQKGGNSLGQSRVAMSEVQICGIPKLSCLEVAPTP